VFVYRVQDAFASSARAESDCSQSSRPKFTSQSENETMLANCEVSILSRTQIRKVPCLNW
jgi:hypothetical protein